MQISDSQEGVVPWLLQSIDSAEAMLDGFVACALEHDAVLESADMQSVQQCVLEATRISAQAKEAESPAKHAHKQLEHVQRLEQTIADLKHDIEKRQALVISKQQLLKDTQQNVQELQQVR